MRRGEPGHRHRAGARRAGRDGGGARQDSRAGWLRARVHVEGDLVTEATSGYRRRLIVAAVLTVPILWLTFLANLGDRGMLITWALATPGQFYVGWPFLCSVAAATRYGGSTMDTLVAVGSLSAYAHSVWATLTGRQGHNFDTARSSSP